MKDNLFFCNGFMSALASCFIVDHLKKQYPESNFYLCVEQNAKGGIVYYNVLEILIKQNKQFKKIVRVKTEFKDLSLRRPFEFLKNFAYYKKIAEDTSRLLFNKNYPLHLCLWAPTVVRLWPFFMKRKVQFNLIEHGLGEYCQVSIYKNARLKKLMIGYIRRALGYHAIDEFDSIWLCSNAVKFEPDEKVVQINFAELFNEYVDKFWLDYQLAFPSAAKELNLLAEKIQANESLVFLYLPSDEIRSEQYARFANEQFASLKLPENATLVIKKHPGDVNANYDDQLERFANIVNISVLENCFIPAEFIVKILKIKNVIGSASSTLFYLKSWMPDVGIHIYNDYDPMMLTNESKDIKKLLDEMGLIKNAIPSC